MSSPIAHDLGRDLQSRIGEVLARQTMIAKHVVSPSELMIMLIEVAVSTALTTAATIASHKEESDRGETFDKVLASIHEMATADRDRSLSAIAAQLRAATR